MKSETTTRPLRELVRQFHRGAILLPQFQRDYIWRPAKIRNLLDSLLRGYPIGGFYFWRPATGGLDYKPKAIGSADIRAEFVGYLIDGQQRLTSLEAAYGLYTGEDKHGAELQCFLDLTAEGGRRRDTRLFVSYAGSRSVARRVDSGDSTLIPLRQLFEGSNHDLRRSTEETLALIPGWSRKEVDEALARLDAAFTMLDQPVPCTTVGDISDQAAVEVFSRLNKGGTPLRQSDLRAAELARGHAVDVLRAMREFVTRERPQRLGFGFSFAFRTLVVFHRESAQFARLREDWMEASGPRGRSLADSWKAAEAALSAALEFIDVTMGWSRRTLVPSANAIIVLAVALDKAELKPTRDAEQGYRKWLCLTALRGVFQGSVETTINRFVRAIRDSRKQPAKSLFEALKRDEARRVRGEDFTWLSHPWGPATQVMHAWLADQDAKDWLTATPLHALARTGSPILPGGDLTVHHIFPRHLLAQIAGDDPDDANSPANFALVSRSTNSEIGDRPPAEVLRTLSPEGRRRAEAQFFSEAAGDRLRNDRYDEFLEWRSERLAEAINDWLGVD